MVEPFGCVVMLHWRLHVYGASVPLSATPTGPSSLFYSPLSHALCSSLRPLSSSSSLFYSHAFTLTGIYHPPIHERSTVRWNGMLSLAHVSLSYSPLFGNYIILTSVASVTTTHTCFFIFHPDIVRRYDRRLLKRLRQARVCRNRKSIIGRSNGLIAIKSNDWNWLFDGLAVIENVRFFYSLLLECKICIYITLYTFILNIVLYYINILIYWASPSDKLYNNYKISLCLSRKIIFNVFT